MNFTAATPRTRRSITIALVWALLWAGAFVAVSLALDSAGPATVVAVRCATAGAILLAFTFRHIKSYTSRQLLAVAAVGVLNNSGYLGLIAAALPHLSAGFAAVLSSTTPLAVLALTAAKARSLAVVPLLGVWLGLAGILASAWGRMQSGQVDALGLGFGSGAVVCLVAATLLTPKLIPAGNPYFLTGWQAVAGAIPVALIAALLEPTMMLTPMFVVCMAYLVIAATVLAMTMWLRLIRDVGAQRASVAHFLPPLFGLGLGAALLGETVTPIELVAAIPVAAGIVLATGAPRLTPRTTRSSGNVGHVAPPVTHHRNPRDALRRTSTPDPTTLEPLKHPDSPHTSTRRTTP